MKNPKNGLVRQYNNACIKIAEKFWNKYYHNLYEINFEIALKSSDIYAIGGDEGGVWQIGDEFWNIPDMATALEYSATIEQVNEWYWNTIGETDETKKKHQSLKNYILYGWITPETSKEEKKRLKENVENAKSDLEKAINSNK